MDFIAVLAGTLGVEPKMDLLPLQPGDVVATCADITRAREKLGFEPRISIAEGIPRFIAWYRQYRSH